MRVCYHKLRILGVIPMNQGAIQGSLTYPKQDVNNGLLILRTG